MIISPNGTTSTTIYYKYKDYDINYAADNNKYGPIIFKKGVCKGFAEAFQDICRKLNIKCEIINGRTTIGHAWNVVSVNGKPMHIDIFYGITMKNNGQDPLQYFLVDTNTLLKYGSHHGFEESLELVTPLIQQFTVIRKNENKDERSNRVTDTSSKNIPGFNVTRKSIPGFKVKR